MFIKKEQLKSIRNPAAASNKKEILVKKNRKK